MYQSLMCPIQNASNPAIRMSRTGHNNGELDLRTEGLDLFRGQSEDLNPETPGPLPQISLGK